MSHLHISQIKVGHMENFTYILESAGTAAIIDPSFGGEKLRDEIDRRRLELKYIFYTHHHFDHVNDGENLANRYGAETVAHADSPVKKDVSVTHGQKLLIGSEEITVIHTPGHTKDSVCYLADGSVFTGDTLFVGECGRVDLPGGSAQEMYASLFRKLARLGDETVVYPGHDYGATPTSTIGREKRQNYVLAPRTLEQFLEFMSSP